MHIIRLCPKNQDLHVQFTISKKGTPITLCMKLNRGTLILKIIPLERCHALDENLCCKGSLDLSKEILHILSVFIQWLRILELAKIKNFSCKPGKKNILGHFTVMRTEYLYSYLVIVTFITYGTNLARIFG